MRPCFKALYVLSIENMDIDKKFILTILVSIIIGSIVGYLATYVDFLQGIIVLVSVISYLIIGAIGIPIDEPSPLRYNFTAFSISGIPAAWLVLIFCLK